LFALHRKETLSRDALALIVTVTVTAAMCLLGTVAAWLKFEVHGGRSTLFTSAFIMAYEGNVPTLYSYTLLNFCALLLFIVAFRERGRPRARRWWTHWLVLGVVFFLLAFDEAASLHEKLVPIFQAHGASGLLYFAWVIPAGIFVAVLGLAYLRFLLALPRDIRMLVVVSAALYVGGALLVELPEGAYAEVYGQNTFVFHAFTVLEETFEMLGLSVFSYTLLRHLRG
jgi:hypothetical protein